MSIRVSSLRFWVVTLAALALACLTFSLGQWQLRRADQKEALQAAILDRKGLPALDTWALAAIQNIASETHRQVVLEGTWQAEQTIFLDNRPMNGKSGFWVFTPLLLRGSKQSVLVQRGWVQRDFNDRTRLPQIDTPARLVQVEGRLAPPPSRLYAFRPPASETGRIRQNLDLDAFRSETGLALFEGSVLQTSGPRDGLLRDWALPNVGVDKHYGYAFQWFALCALTVVLYGWFQVRPAVQSLQKPPARLSTESPASPDPQEAKP
jgi:surfeit locus 1 family protein